MSVDRAPQQCETTIAGLADVAVNQVLTSGGVGVAPAWSATPTVTSITLLDHAVWTTGAAVTAGNYSVGRDADGTNQLHFNVPSGAGFEFSVNDVARALINTSGLIYVGEGSVAGVAFGWNGDSDTGLYHPQGNTAGMASGGVEAMRWADHTVASATGAVADVISIPAQTVTITGSTNITTATGFNLINIGIPTYSAATTMVITAAASLYLAGPPVGGGVDPPTFTNVYTLWIDTGAVRFDDHVQWGAGVAVTAGNYSVGRDADGTNQLHFNAPDGASMEWSINDTGYVVLSAAGRVGINTGTLALSTALVVGGLGGTNAGLEVDAGTSMAISAYNRNTSAYAPLNFYASTVLLSSAGAAGLTVNSTVAQMGNDFKFAYDVNAGVTASTTQTQGQGPLTADVNEVATVANANDTVTLPAAVAGLRIVVINNGANTLRIFPALGDNLGAGVNTATTLASGSNVVYQAYDATNWESI